MGDILIGGGYAFEDVAGLDVSWLGWVEPNMGQKFILGVGIGALGLGCLL